MRFSALIQTGRLGAVLLALALLGGHAAAGETPLRIGAHAFKVERATTPEARRQGLMGRTRLAADGGMLFVFEQPDIHCFWMRNTPLPLSIAFIDAGGRVVSLADMQPYSEALHCSPSAIRYALEVQQGGFSRRGIAPGAQVEGLPR